MKTTILFLFLFILPASLKAQNNQNQSDSTQIKQNRFIVEMTGQIGVTSDFRENVFLNLGGPGLKLYLSRKFSFSMTMYPSIRFGEEGKIMPMLGSGLQFFIYKKYLVQIPIYYINNGWIVSAGLGFKIADPWMKKNK